MSMVPRNPRVKRGRCGFDRWSSRRILSAAGDGFGQHRDRLGASFAHDQASLRALAEGKYPGTTNEREGIVIRPREERFSAALNGRLSFKAISNTYLLDERD